MSINRFKKKKFNSKRFWFELWSLLRPSRKDIKKVVFVIFIMEALALVGPYFLKIIIDLITNFKTEDIDKMLFLIIMMLLVNQLNSFVDFRADKMILKIISSIQEYLFSSAHKKLIFLSLNYHLKENTGNKINRISSGAEKIRHLTGSLLWDVIPIIFQAVMTIVVLFWVDWRFGMVVLVLAPIFVSITMYANNKAFPNRKKIFDRHEEATGLVGQSIININTVKSFVQEEKEYGQVKKIVMKARDLTMSTYSWVFRSNLAKNLVIDTGRVAILFLGIYLIWKGQSTIGSVVFVLTISEKALISLYRISRLYDQIMESSEAVTRLYALSQEKSDIKNPIKGINPKKIDGELRFKNLNFTYKESGIQALRNVNTKIRAGSMVALVGPSGGGKTTLARMVYRHYDPDEGAVLLDNNDLRNYDLYGFRKFIAIVPQEVEVFNASIRENIAYAKSGATLSEIKNAARIANANEFIEKLSDGFNTLVGERGMKLSGGQRQRIGIARAILANPSILIFDEATSSLDSQSERLIQDSMDKIAKGRTVIIIAHRLSTIKRASKIIVLEEGQVVEEGSHNELAKADGGLYQKLLNLQKLGDVV